MSKAIFISHSVKDQSVIDKFIDLLSNGANICRDDIFCSSQTGSIPTGANFVDYIHDEIQDAKVVIPFFSKNYVNSEFCLCELGAAWINTEYTLPVIIPEFDFCDINPLFEQKQCTKIDDKYALLDLIKELKEIVHPKKEIVSSILERKRDEFLRELPEILRNLPVQETYSKIEYDKIKDENEKLLNELSDRDNEIISKNSLIEKLKQAKDKAEVTSILRETTETTSYDRAVEDVISAFRELDSVVIYALYNYLRGEEIHIGNYYEHKILADDCEQAEKRQYLTVSDNTYSLNFDDPNVQEANDAIEVLEDEINSLESDKLDELKKDYRMDINLSNIRFWDSVLNTNIDRYNH